MKQASVNLISFVKSTTVMMSVLFLNCAQASESNWVHVIPDISDSQEVDLASVNLSNIGWEAWTRTTLISDSERPSDVTLPENALLHVKMQVICSEESITAKFLTADFRLPKGEVIYQFPADAANEINFPTREGISYGKNTPSFICAAAAAKCSNAVFNWPLPRKTYALSVPKCK